MKIFDWKELALLAREKSDYYKQLYRDLSNLEKISDLPAVDQDEFWEANNMKQNRVITGSMDDGIVFKSGGTTGNPKFSVYTRQEWDDFCQAFGAGMSKIGLRAADRIANLFYVGELYASFIFIMKCTELAPTPALQFPISGSTDPVLILKTVQEFNINVIAGLPTTIMNVAETYASDKQEYGNLRVERILFGGESMYPDQRSRLEELFPGVRIYSIGYASVDAGLIGYADETCGNDEHRVFGSATTLEIIDEDTLEPIEEVGRPGKILLTNRIRSLMPVIRYPVGDRAMWCEPLDKNNPDRKYAILGRSEEAARVGPVSVYYEDMRDFLANLDLGIPIASFQLVIKHFELKDALTVRIVSSTKDKHHHLSTTIAQQFGVARKMFAEAVTDKKIHPLLVEWIEPSEVEINARTGKLKRVIDQRR